MTGGLLSRCLHRQLSLRVLHRPFVRHINRKPFLWKFSRYISMAEIGAIATIIGVAGAGTIFFSGPVLYILRPSQRNSNKHGGFCECEYHPAPELF